MIDLKVKFLLGEINLDEYGAKAEKLLASLTSNLNKVIVQLNLLKYEVNRVLLNRDFKKEFEEKLLSFFETLGGIEISENKKSILISNHCQTVSTYSSSYILHIYFRMKIREELGGKLQDSTKIELLNRYLTLSNKVDSNLKIAFELAVKSNDSLLESEVLFTTAQFFFTRYLNQFVIRQVESLDEELEDLHSWHALAFIRAYNGFV